MKSFLLEQENLGTIFFNSRDWRIQEVNHKASQMLAVSQDQLKKKRIPEVISLPKEILLQIKNNKLEPDETVVEHLFFLPNHTILMGLIVKAAQENYYYFMFFSLEETKKQLFLPQLRFFIKDIHFAGLLMDARGNLMYASQKFSKITGYCTRELIGKNFFKTFFTEKNYKLYYQQFIFFLKNEFIPQTMQFPLRRKNGKTVQTLWNLKFLLNTKNEIIGVSGIGLDIGYLTIESQRAFKNEKLETIIANIASMFAQVPTYKVDASINKTLKMVGEYANVDRSYVFIFRDNQQIMQNTHEWCAEGIEPQIENLQAVPSKIVPWWMKFLLKHEIIHIPRVSELPPEANSEKEILQAQDIQSLIVVPMVDNEELIGFIGFDSVRMPKYWANEDINLLKIVSSIFVSSLKRKSTELSLADSERKYRTLFNTAPDLIFILNPEAKIESLNPAFTAITNQKVEEWIGRPFAELLATEDRKLFENRFQNCLKGKFQKPYELKIKTADGIRVLETICSPVSFSGNKKGVYGIARDISDRKMLEENLRHAERMKSVGLLAGGIAHDFNNILGIIHGNYTIIKEQLNQRVDLQTPLESIRQAVERGKTLVQNLLTFARKKEPQYEILDLHQEIKNVINLLRQTTPKTIKFQLHLSKEPVFILSDQIQIHQMLLNLCLNAIDAIRENGKPGKIEIGTKLLAPDELPKSLDPRATQSYVHLFIKDTGKGLAKDEVKYIFDPFYSSKEGGTGLGLSVVFGIVKSMKGHIVVDPEEGKGAVFHLFLPVSQKKVTTGKWKHRIDKTLLYGSARIFLIEDDLLLSQMLRHLLETHGYKVTTAFAGDKAVETYAREHDNFDLIILDFDLPEKDGLNVAREFKAIYEDTKIILTSGFLEPEIRQQVDQMPDVYFVEKPYDPEKILESIPLILNKKPKGKNNA